MRGLLCKSTVVVNTEVSHNKAFQRNFVICRCGGSGINAPSKIFLRCPFSLNPLEKACYIVFFNHHRCYLLLEEYNG